MKILGNRENTGKCGKIKAVFLTCPTRVRGWLLMRFANLLVLFDFFYLHCGARLWCTLFC